MAVLDVHVFEPVSLFLPVELVQECLLEVDSLDVEDLHEALVVALVAQQVEQGSPAVVLVQLLMDNVRGCAKVGHQVQHDVLETQVAI